jgi:hypothetical protein
MNWIGSEAANRRRHRSLVVAAAGLAVRVGDAGDVSPPEPAAGSRRGGIFPFSLAGQPIAVPGPCAESLFVDGACQPVPSGMLL